jgi:hypothetical protein
MPFRHGLAGPDERAMSGCQHRKPPRTPNPAHTAKTRDLQPVTMIWCFTMMYVNDPRGLYYI